MSFASRIQQQTFAYDWLGNTTQTNDDANGFYDRSLGVITNGPATAGPYQIQSAALVRPGTDALGHWPQSRVPSPRSTTSRGISRAWRCRDRGLPRRGRGVLAAVRY